MNKKLFFILTLLACSIYFYIQKSTDILIILCLFGLYILYYNNNCDNNEHLDNVSSTPSLEAIQNISSMFNNNTITATNIKVTGEIQIGDGLVLKSSGKNGYIKSPETLHISSDTQNIFLLNGEYGKPPSSGKIIVGTAWGGSGNLNVDGSVITGIGHGVKSAGNLVLSSGGDVIVDNAKGSNTSDLIVKGNVYIPENRSTFYGKDAGIGVFGGNLAGFGASGGRALFLSNIANNTFVPSANWNAYESYNGGETAKIDIKKSPPKV